MKWMAKLSFLLLLAFCCSTCIDVITFTRDDDKLKAIVIQGKIVKAGKVTVNIYIDRLFTKIGIVSSRRIEVRSVDIIDEEGNELAVRLKATGHYQLEIPEDHPSFKVAYGKSYQIRVVGSNGNVFESELDMLRPVPEIQQLTFSRFEKERIERGISKITPWITYHISTGLRPEGYPENVNLNFEFSHVWQFTTFGLPNTVPVCWISTKIGVADPLNVDGLAINQDYIENYPLIDREINFNYAEGNSFTVIQESVTEKTSNYLKQLRQLATRSGSMFEPAPGNLENNIQQLSGEPEDIFGYFYATSHDTARLFIGPEEVGSPVPYGYCDRDNPAREYFPLACGDCLRYEPHDGSGEPPWFWPK